MKITRQILSDLPAHELETVVKMAEEIAAKRRRLREIELWEKVMVALDNYQREGGKVKISDNIDHKECGELSYIGTPGYFTVKFNE